MLRSANLGVKFLLELAAFAAFAYWGSGAGGGALPVVLAVVAPAVAIALWGAFAAPRSKRRLARAARVPFELSVFALAIGALLCAGHPVVAIVFGVVVFINAVLLTVFHQWDG